MLELLKIDLKKMTNYRTFWVVCGLYFLTLAFVTASGMEVLKWLVSKGAEFGAEINLTRIPLYHFPDIWQNLLYISGFFKIVLGVMVIISVTNEYTYRTVRQNIIDGLSRWQFLQSKILMNALLSITSVVMMLIIVLVTGMIYSPEVLGEDVLSGFAFLPAYFLEVFSWLSYALLLSILVQRSGLTIILLMLSGMIEAIIKVNFPEEAEWAFQFFPMQSMTNLIQMPFARYAFKEIQDYVAIGAVAISIVWTVVFNYLAYLKLQKSDI